MLVDRSEVFNITASYWTTFQLTMYYLACYPEDKKKTYKKLILKCNFSGFLSTRWRKYTFQGNINIVSHHF